MASINVNMSDELRQFVDRQVKAEGFSTPTEYVRQLIRDAWKEDAKKREAHAQIERLLIEGLESGSAGPMTEERWNRIFDDAIARHRAKSGSST